MGEVAKAEMDYMNARIECDNIRLRFKNIPENDLCKINPDYEKAVLNHWYAETHLRNIKNQEKFSNIFQLK